MMSVFTISVSNEGHKTVADVSRVVHGQTNGYHKVDAGHNVDGEAPQVHDTRHINLQKELSAVIKWKKQVSKVTCPTLPHYLAMLHKGMTDNRIIP